MIKIVVGSKNPVKINAAKAAICDIFSSDELECVGINAPSQVADQPMTVDETQLGAINRVKYCQQHTQADFYLAIEGGVDQFKYGPATFAYVAIAGEELGDVMDRFFNTDNVKQKQGAIGLLTNGLATRESVYRQAILLAMAPFIHSDLYSE